MFLVARFAVDSLSAGIAWLLSFSGMEVDELSVIISANEQQYMRFSNYNNNGA